MPLYDEVSYRQSTDPLSPNKWFVYRAKKNKSQELILPFDSESEAVKHYELILNSEIEKKILSLDSTQIVPPDFFKTQIKEKIPLHAAVEIYFSQNPFDVTQLTPVKGEPLPFHEETRFLSRPYIAITNAEFENFEKGESDYYMTSSGTLVIFGAATVEGGNTRFALMPRKPLE